MAMARDDDENGKRLAVIQLLLDKSPDLLTLEHVTELQEIRLRLEQRMNKGEAWLNDYQRGLNGIDLEANDSKFRRAGELLVMLSSELYPQCTSLLKVLMQKRLIRSQLK